MPREFSIVRSDGSPLGDVAAVRSALESALPGIQFFREPSGLEKIEKMAAIGVEFPEVLRRHLENSPATTQADFEGEGYSIRFFLGCGPVVVQLDAEGRGDGDPSTELRGLEERLGWVVQSRFS